MRSDGGPDRIRTGDLQRDRLACWAATPRVQSARAEHSRDPRMPPHAPRRPVWTAAILWGDLGTASRAPTGGVALAVSTTADRAAHAAGRWADLRARLQTVTPEAVGRIAVALAAVGISTALVVGTWPAMLPFVAGRGPRLRGAADREHARPVHAPPARRDPRGARGPVDHRRHRRPRRAAADQRAVARRDAPAGTGRDRPATRRPPGAARARSRSRCAQS